MSELIKLKYLCKSFCTPIMQQELNERGLYEVYGATGIAGYMDTYSVDTEYLGIVKDGAGVGRVNKYKPCTSLLGTLAYIIPNNQVDIDWLKYVVISMDLGNDTGKTTIPHIYFSNYGNKKVPYITYDKQNCIAKYIEKKCVEIDKIFMKTRATIVEYKKLRQAVITQAVTRGIRGEREMRDSGIEWIGEIPKEWSYTQLGRFITIESGISVGKSYPKNTELVEVPYLRVANVQGDYVDTSDIATLFVTPDEAEKYRLHAGQLLMTEGGDRDKLGRGCLWNGEIDPCIHQNHIFAVETNELLDIKYLDYITTSDIARVYFDITAKKTTNLACTNKSTILRFIIPVPSKIEQIEIREYLDAECPKIDSIIEKKEKYLFELDNYRKSLIYEYVTGKKEVPQE